MGTIESKLSYLLRTKEEIREAIIGKGVKVTAEDTFRSYADKIRSIVGTTFYVPSLAPKGVNFKDYDGGVLHTYTKDEFLALTEMPALPERPRLVCQGWNWSLEDAKAYVEEYGYLTIGATYITDNGKTRFYIKVEGERKTLPIQFSIDKANSLTIDWGDGASESVSGSNSLNVSHTYDSVGDYVVSFEVAEGATLSIGTSTYYTISPPYSIMLRKVELGDRVKIRSSAFQNCYSLSSVVIPNSVTSIGDYAFQNCYSLSSVVIPNSVTSIGNYAFEKCYSLSSVVIPNSVTSIGGSAFQSCSGIAYFDFRTHTSVPTLSNYMAFSGIASDAKIVVSDELYDSWISATNWSNSNVAKYIVKASEFNG